MPDFIFLTGYNINESEEFINERNGTYTNKSLFYKDKRSFDFDLWLKKFCIQGVRRKMEEQSIRFLSLCISIRFL